MKIGDFVSNMAEDRQEVMALYQARHRTTARRRFHATTEAGPAPAKPWKPSQTAACVVVGRIREARQIQCNRSEHSLKKGGPYDETAVQEARESWQDLETELQTAEQKQKSIRPSGP